MYLHISLISPFKMEGLRSLQSWNKLSGKEFAGVAWSVYQPAGLGWKHVELAADRPGSYLIVQGNMFHFSFLNGKPD